MVFEKVFASLLLTLLCPSALSQQQCTDTGSRFNAPSTGECLNTWSGGGTFTYPDDFDDVLNEVVVYTCPISEKRIIISNGIPDHTVTSRKNAIPCEINWAVSLPLFPTKANDPIEIPAKGIIAMATNGVPAYGAKEAGDSNAVEPNGDIQDAQFWYGHATSQGVWHAHNPYMGEESPDSTTLLGWGLDGFAIYGPLGSSEIDSLDNCNGREGQDGVYQYHVREKTDVDESLNYCKGDDNPETNWNYILGCYHGTTDNTQVTDSASFTIPSDCEVSNGDPTTTSPVESPVKSPMQSPPTNTGRPNIIVMQPDDMEFFENWTPPPKAPTNPNQTNNFPATNGMPNMEILRLNGAQMMEAYTTSPACGTSRYSTITGKYPSRAASARRKNINGIAEVTIPMTKLQDWGDEKDCTEDNMAAALRTAGYRTGMVGKWHLSRIKDNKYNYWDAVDIVKECGFDFVDALYIENISADPNQFDNYSDGTFSHNMEFVTHEAIRFIEDSDDEKPFFLYVNPTVPHSSQAVDVALDDFTCQDTPRKDVTSDFVIKGMTEEYGGSCELYRDSVRVRADSTEDLGSIWLDDSVGAILQALEDNGVLDNTLFVFQQDHGVGAKGALYEGGSRIAQFIHYPAVIPAGTQYDIPVSTIDIAATLLDYAGVDVTPYAMDGKSWKNDISNSGSRNTNTYSRCLFFEMDYDRAVRCGCDKYLTIDQKDASTSGTYKTGVDDGYSTDFTNLFDLCGGTSTYITTASANQESDGLNLEDDEASKAAEMATVLDCHMDRTSHSAEPGDLTSCELNVSPTATPILSPVAEPTPVSEPTAPSVSDQCVDSSLRFKVPVDDKMVARSCEWVARKKTDERCAISGVSDTCPSACGTCGTCSDSPLRIKFLMEGETKKIARSCEWVARRLTDERCVIDGMADTCRATCGSC